jgi:hypothetical protein
MYTFLHQEDLPVVLKRNLLRLIPAEWKSSWAHLLPSLHEDFQRMWDTSGLRDITDNIDEFESSISSGHLREVIAALNNYPIESVSPKSIILGCYIIMPGFLSTFRLFIHLDATFTFVNFDPCLYYRFCFSTWMLQSLPISSPAKGLVGLMRPKSLGFRCLEQCK